MADDVESLVVQLEARIDKFEKNLERANRTAQTNFSQIESRAAQMAKALESGFSGPLGSITGLFKNLGSSFLGAAGISGLGLTALTTAAIKFNSELAKIPGLARDASLSTDRLQEVKFAANVGCVSDDEFT